MTAVTRVSLPVCPTIAAVTSGRREGYLQGTCIVASALLPPPSSSLTTQDWHLTIVSARYSFSRHEEHIVSGQPPDHWQLARRTNVVLAMVLLPPGMVPHLTDSNNITALLTAAKQVRGRAKFRHWHGNGTHSHHRPPTTPMSVYS